MPQIPRLFMNLNSISTKSAMDWDQNMFDLRNNFKYNSKNKTENNSFPSVIERESLQYLNQNLSRKKNFINNNHSQNHKNDHKIFT